MTDLDLGSTQQDPTSTEAKARPCVSVVIPAHHSTAYIWEALESIQAVKKPLEIIVVENGSDDLATPTLQRFAGSHSVRLIHLDQADLSTARNVGLDAANGKWILFLDSDDLIDATALDVALDIQGLESCSVVSWARSTSKDGQTPLMARGLEGRVNWLVQMKPGGHHLLQQISRRDYSPIVGGYLFSRVEIHRTGIRFSEGYLHEDHAFTAGMIFSAPWVARISGVILGKRTWPNSLSVRMAPLISTRGYRRALKDLEQYATTAPLRTWAEKWAYWWLRARLSVIYRKKLLQHNDLSLLGRGSQFASLAAHSVRYAALDGCIQVIGRLPGRGFLTRTTTVEN